MTETVRMRRLDSQVPALIVINTMLGSGTYVFESLDEIEREQRVIYRCPPRQSEELRSTKTDRLADSCSTRTNCLRASSDVTRRCCRRIRL